MHKVSFNNREASFYTAIKEEVDTYFTTNSMKKTGNWRLYLKTGVLIPLATVIYLSLLFANLPAWAAISLCMLLGIVISSIGFNVMHDACHGSFSSKPWVNNFLGLTINAMGGNAFIWKQKHNIVHHTYTNVDGVDDDIAKSPVIRMCNTQKWVPIHKIQHLYVSFVYMFSSLAWVFLLDFTKYLSKSVLETPFPKMSFQDHFLFWFSKVMYVVFYMIVPIYFVGFTPWLIGFSCMHAMMGLVLAIVFQLAHVVEKTEFEEAKTDYTKIDQHWAIHQVRTTANFARNNKVISWLVGGLNFQVEHHLFPRVSHIHYPAISEIVKKNCEKFDLPYNEYPTMVEAIVSHYKVMKQFGERPPVHIMATI
jgi:linoleoyl-CoA desaturase